MEYVIRRKIRGQFQYWHNGARRFCLSGTIYKSYLKARQTAQELTKGRNNGLIGVCKKTSSNVKSKATNDNRPIVYLVWQNRRCKGRLNHDNTIELFRKFYVSAKYLHRNQLGALASMFRNKLARPRSISPDVVQEQSPYNASIVAELLARPIEARKAAIELDYQTSNYTALSGKKYQLYWTNGATSGIIERNPTNDTYKIDGASYDSLSIVESFGLKFADFIISECIDFDAI